MFNTSFFTWGTLHKSLNSWVNLTPGLSSPLSMVKLIFLYKCLIEVKSLPWPYFTPVFKTRAKLTPGLIQLNFNAKFYFNEDIDNCDNSQARTTRVRHKWETNDSSATRVLIEWKCLILIGTRVKAYLHTSILAKWQIYDCKERNSFILRTVFWKCLVPMPKCVWRVHHKNWIL